MNANAPVLRAQALLALGLTVTPPGEHDPIRARVLLHVGGPGSRTGSVCFGASTVLDMPYEAVDGRAEIAPRVRPALFHAVLGRDAPSGDLRRLVEAVGAFARGSIVVVPMHDAEAVRDAVSALADMRDVTVVAHVV